MPPEYERLFRSRSAAPLFSGLYAIALAWPADGKISIKSLAEGSAADLGAIEGVQLLGSDATLKWARDRGGLQIELPAQKTGEYAWVFRVTHSSR